MKWIALPKGKAWNCFWDHSISRFMSVPTPHWSFRPQSSAVSVPYAKQSATSVFCSVMLQGFNIEICQVKKELIISWLMHWSLQGSEYQTFLEGKKCLILIVTLSCVFLFPVLNCRWWLRIGWETDGASFKMAPTDTTFNPFLPGSQPDHAFVCRTWLCCAGVWFPT